MSSQISSQTLPSTLTPTLDVAAWRAVVFSGRTVKITCALALCVAGSFGALSESAYISTSNAIVSATVVDVRAPIEGTVSGLPAATGSLLRSDEVIASVDNPRSDREHLDNLLALENGAAAVVAALTSERQVLLAQQHGLLQRADAHSSAVAARLREQTVEAEHTLSGLQLALTQSTAELRRAEQLHTAGIVSNADFDRTRSAQLIAAEAVATQQSHVKTMRGQAADAGRGVLSEAGAASDVSYSRQRADELSIKLADNASALASATAQSLSSHNNLQAESLRGALMRQAEMRSPVQGYVWKVNANNGERTAAGASLVSVVDCSRQFVLAQIPQDRVPGVTLHSMARIRLAGESVERFGTVLAVEGNVLNTPGANLATMPLQVSADPMATVRIELNSGTAPEAPQQAAENAACVIGRSARVLIPATPSNRASRWLHELF